MIFLFCTKTLIPTQLDFFFKASKENQDINMQGFYFFLSFVFNFGSKLLTNVQTRQYKTKTEGKSIEISFKTIYTCYCYKNCYVYGFLCAYKINSTGKLFIRNFN